MSATHLIRRRAMFAGANLVLVLIGYLLIAAPLLDHFADRRAQINETAERLARLRLVSERAAKLSRSETRPGNVYLPGTEERVASADLQANLLALANANGLAVKTLRGLPGRPAGQWRAVPVSLEIEGPLAALRELIAAVEGQTPFLFITDVALRTAADGDDGRLIASLTVEGALRPAPHPGAEPVAEAGASTGPLAAAER